jgi:hypothetical protein
MVLENTFEGIDFTFDGVIKDRDSDLISVTARKTDGTPFELDDGYFFRSLYNFERPYVEGENVYKGEDIYMSGETYNMQLNEDGSISIEFYTTWGNDKDVVLGIEDILEMSSSNDYAYTDVLNKGIHIGNDSYDIYNASTPSEKAEALENYNSLCEEYENSMQKISNTVCKGRLLFIAYKTESNNIYVSSDSNEFGYKIIISSISLSVSATEGGTPLWEDDWDKITLKFKDGTTEEYTSDSASGKNPKETAFLYFDKPVDTESIIGIEVDGNYVEIN